MIVTKARDHGLVKITRDLAEWLMTTPRHGKPYGVNVHVDGKLEKSKRFDADGLYKDHRIVRDKNLLHFWTPETCVCADTFDIVITVHITIYHSNHSWEATAQYYTLRGFSRGLFLQSLPSVLDHLGF
jgi:hypothetical protein